MKKLIIYLILSSLCFTIFGCSSPIDDINITTEFDIAEKSDIPVIFASDINQTDYKSALYFFEYDPDTLAESLADSGGIDHLKYTYPLQPDFLFIENRLRDYVGNEIFLNWVNNEVTNGTWEMVNVLTYIEHFELTKEQFVEACHFYPGLPLYGKTVYEIADVLFSGDIEAVLRYTKMPGAVYSNGKLFSAQWLDLHTIEDYIAEGIDSAEIELSKQATIDAIQNFSRNPESGYEAKCSSYEVIINTQ
jgi:hypothetical protein